MPINNEGFNYDKSSLEYYLQSIKVFKDVLSKECRPGFVSLFADFTTAYDALIQYVSDLQSPPSIIGVDPEEAKVYYEASH